jgi:hypothetical protein
MTALGWTFIGAAIATGVYGFAWALCNAARMGDDALDNLDDAPRFQQFDVEPRYVEAEIPGLETAFAAAPYDQERP